MPSAIRSIGIAVLSVGVATAAVAAAASYWGGRPTPVILFVVPLLASAWLGDLLAICLTSVLTVLAAVYVVPGGGFLHLDATGYLRIFVFFGIASSLTLLVIRIRGTEHLQHAASSELRHAEERLRHALDAGGMVAWRWDPSSDLIVRTGRVRELFGVDETASGRAFYGLVHPLDRERYRQVVQDAIVRRIGYDVVFRFPRPDTGEVRWVEKRAAPIVRPDGTFGGFTGIAQDVTGRYDLQAAIRARELQLRLIVDAVPALIAYVDADQRYGIVNRAYEEWFGVGSDRLSGRHMSEVLGASHYEDLRPHVEAALDGRGVEFESTLAHHDGTRRVLRASYIPDVDEDIVRGFFVLVLDVTDDRRREQALRDAERDARLANELKDQFLATLSHELRTPLNAMLGYARMAHLGVVPHDRALEVIERNARLQARLVEDLLDVSRMVSGKLQFTMGSVDLAGIATDVVHMLHPLADAKSVQLRAHVPSVPGPVVVGDEARLRQMLVNLVSNAVKFTPDGGGVTVRLVPESGVAAIAVEDTGVGIAPELLPVIFDRFRQADSSASREHGGLGLGLSIARTIAEAHGGSIGAASPGVGCGATFTVRLPVPAATPVPDAAAQVS